MKGVFVIHHMKRSGGHAVINWLADNSPGSKFINNEIPIQGILSGQRSVPEAPVSYADWLDCKRRSGELTNAIGEASAVLVSLEDHELWVRPFDHPTAETIMILRHPQNLFASRIRKATNTSLLAYQLGNPELLARAVRVWKEHARAALGGVEGSWRLTPVFYDAWLTGEEYRRRLARHFDFAAPCAPSRQTAPWGGGSSFGQAAVNPVDLKRRADLLDAAEKAILTTIMSDPEIAELADRIAAWVARLSALPPSTADSSA